MATYELVIGLEVHVQLKTATKLFCGCVTRFGTPPNTLVCPICMGMPGVLPVVNRSVFELALRAALALNCQITPFTKMDRKNYFYPDLPKDYQISQYDVPLSRSGVLDILHDGETKHIRIVRVHLEEDAGKLIHQENGDRSLVDLNRCGVPLIEIVSEPDMRSSAEAYAYLTTLKSILQAIEVSDCDMEKGELRCDINLSLCPKGSEKLGTKVEIKNLNSFKFAAKAIDYETERQRRVLESGGRLVQETRLYDSDENVTHPMRSKEEAHDYRYFPEPDLPPFVVTAEQVEVIRRSLPELPYQRSKRFQEKYALTAYEAGLLTSDKTLADFFEACAEQYPSVKAISNWLLNDILRLMNEHNQSLAQTKLQPASFVSLLRMVEEGKVTGASAKSVLEEMLTNGAMPDKIVQEKGLAQVSDATELEKMVDKVISENPPAVADYKAGKKTAMTFLMGQVMKTSRGKANPKVIQELLTRKLDR